MNMNIVLQASRTIKNAFQPVKQVCLLHNVMRHQQHARSVWYMTSNFTNKPSVLAQYTNYQVNQNHTAHTKAEKELVEFLTEEILAERKVQKTRTIPTDLDGFKAKLNGAEVSLTKVVDNEKIKITFNINHTVDTDVEPEVNPNNDKPELGELKSKPAFRVEIERGTTTLNLACSFVHPDENDGEYSDIFVLDEISIYEGESNENIYAVSGEVLDSYLYDLILNYLEEKGISNEFVEKLSAYSTAFEHSAYIGLLESLSKFVSHK